jgi:hypothetical protein
MEGRVFAKPMQTDTPVASLYCLTIAKTCFRRIAQSQQIAEISLVRTGRVGAKLRGRLP